MWRGVLLLSGVVVTVVLLMRHQSVEGFTTAERNLLETISMKVVNQLVSPPVSLSKHSITSVTFKNPTLVNKKHKTITDANIQRASFFSFKYKAYLKAQPQFYLSGDMVLTRSIIVSGTGKSKSQAKANANATLEELRRVIETRVKNQGLM